MTVVMGAGRCQSIHRTVTNLGDLHTNYQVRSSRVNGLRKGGARRDALPHLLGLVLLHERWSDVDAEVGGAVQHGVALRRLEVVGRVQSCKKKGGGGGGGREQ